MTTNDELLFKNDYKNYQSRPNAVNVFENTFKLNQGKMTLDTVYNKEFDKRKLKNVKRDPLVTKADMELRQQKVVSKIPMSMETQTMADFKFNPSAYRSPSQLSATHQDLFKSKLNKNLYPPEFDLDECDDNALQTVSIMNFQHQPQQQPQQNMYETNYACSFQDKSQASALINGSTTGSDMAMMAGSQDKETQRKIHSSSQPNMMHKKNIVTYFFIF